MSNELCPFCGSEAKEWYEGKSVGCSNRLCSLRSLFAIADWNRRFVCLDKNGGKVFAGDKVKRVPYTGDPNPHPYQTEGRTGTVVWHYGFLQWCFLDDKTNHMDDLVDSEIFEDGIELIKEPDHVLIAAAIAKEAEMKTTMTGDE